jgi:protocatechuate 3,4-dioxygenase beta subunit
MNRRQMLSLAASVVVSQTFRGRRVGRAGGASCVLTAPLTEGPFFVDEKLARSDLRSDPATGVVSAGAPLRLRFVVSRVDSASCAPLTGAYVDVWNCNAEGAYSDISSMHGPPPGGPPPGMPPRGGPPNGPPPGMAQAVTAGQKFLRGYQITDANGVVEFTTVYPGWYPGRTVHVHFKVRMRAGAATRYEFTSQLFFDDALTDTVHSRPPYSGKSSRDMRNVDDDIFASLSQAERDALILRPARSSAGIYSAVVNLGVSPRGAT